MWTLVFSLSYKTEKNGHSKKRITSKIDNFTDINENLRVKQVHSIKL